MFATVMSFGYIIVYITHTPNFNVVFRNVFGKLDTSYNYSCTGPVHHDWWKDITGKSVGVM